MPEERISQTSEAGARLPRSIAEKTAESYFDEPKRVYKETAGLASSIADIIGQNADIHSRIPETQASELASLLINLRHELSAGNHQDAISLLDDAIELCFLHTPVYEVALEAYRLECVGLLVGDDTVIETLQVLITRSKRHSLKKGGEKDAEEN